MKHVGFTGTREGMTSLQREKLRRLLLPYFESDDTVYHHGDCVGADSEFHDIIRENAWNGGIIVGHIPVDDTHRAFRDFDSKEAPLKHMARNKRIVEAADVMFATPLQMEEQEFGGTWRTIRMARKAGKPLTIVYPDGSVSE